MSHYAVCSVKGAPGATTLALAMTCALTHAQGQPAAMVEADPAGGDLAALLGLATVPGMVSLAAAARHQSAWPDIRGHGQNLPAGGWALLGPTDPAQASAAIATLRSRLMTSLGPAAAGGVIDCGRWTPASPASPLLREVTATAICIKASVAAIEAVRVRAAELWDVTGGRLGLVVMGRGRYGAGEIEACTGLRVVGEIGYDERGCSGLLGATWTRVDRSSVVRSARSIAERLSAFSPPRPAGPQTNLHAWPTGVRQ